MVGVYKGIISVPKPRTCEHCDTVIPLEQGFYFDKDMNLICGFCGEIVCATEEETTVVGTQQQHYAGYCGYD